MSLEIVDDLHELIAENKRLKKEIDCLKTDMAYVLQKLKEFRPSLELSIEYLTVDPFK